MATIAGYSCCNFAKQTDVVLVDDGVDDTSVVYPDTRYQHSRAQLDFAHQLPSEQDLQKVTCSVLKTSSAKCSSRVLRRVQQQEQQQGQ